MIIEPIPFTSIDNIIENIEFYKKQFLQDGILAFRDANLTEAEQKEFQRRMGDCFKVFPNTQDYSVQQYTENHEGVFDESISGDEIMLGWHMEHLYFKNPIIMGFWNMQKFDTDKENGKTYFYDSRKLWNEIPVDWKEFLSKCTIDATSELDPLDKAYLTKVVDKHWYTDETVLRLSVNKDYDEVDVLKLFDGREPSDHEKAKYTSIMQDIIKMLNDSGNKKKIHKWKKGDLLIPDMYVMIHAVTGGFSPSDRSFTGMWSFPEKFTPSS